MQGILNLDKPAGLSSAAAVNRVKRLIPRGTKIGHAGTLDPFATGVLLLLIGKATRLCEQLMDQPKQYETTIKFGATTATDDPEAPEESIIAPDVSVDRAAIDAALPRFVGDIQQTPPIYSAMKVAGRRAYDLARKGHAVTLQPRTVKVYRIDVLNFEWPLLRLKIECGRGTYIRAIARDLGVALHTGGYLTQLRRTRVGPFYADQSLPLDGLVTAAIEAKLTDGGFQIA